jgi:hypothetical protein
MGSGKTGESDWASLEPQRAGIRHRQGGWGWIEIADHSFAIAPGAARNFLHHPAAYGRFQVEASVASMSISAQQMFLTRVNKLTGDDR